MKETPKKVAAYFAIGGAWALVGGLTGLVGPPGLATLLAIWKIVLGVAFLNSARQFNESLVHSPQKLLWPLWGTGAWIVVWFLARVLRNEPRDPAGKLFTLIWVASVLLIAWYLRKNALRFSAVYSARAIAVTKDTSSLSTQHALQQDRVWDVFAGFALISGMLPMLLLEYFEQFKRFGQFLALSFYIGLGLVFLLAILLALVSAALWLGVAAAIWYRKRIGLLLLAILCGLRSTTWALFVLASLKLGFLSPKPGAALSPTVGRGLVLILVAVAAVYGAAMIFSWRRYRSGLVTRTAG